MPFSTDHNRGKEKHDVDRAAFDRVLERWKNAYPDSTEEAHLALAVLSHAGAMKQKLSDLIDDPNIVNAIMEDATRV